MRVTSTLLSDQALAALRDSLSRMATNQSRLATGRRLQTPSDDPSGHAGAVRLGARLAATAQFKSQAGWAAEQLDTTGSTLNSLVDVMGRVQELAVTGANGTLGPSERSAMAVEVNALLEEVVDLANTSHGGRYLLGGRETTTPPLVVTRNAAGDITAAAWNPRGVDGAIDVSVAEGTTVQANLGGSSVLGADTDPTFLPTMLIQLRDALAANDQVAVNAALTGLDTAEGRLTLAQATAGSRLRSAQRVLDDLDNASLVAQSALSTLVDTDVARVAVELQQQEAVYQAALHAASQAIQPSLLEFLR